MARAGFSRIQDSRNARWTLASLPYRYELCSSLYDLSTIGLAQPGKIEKGQRQEDCRNRLHQLHVCLPAGRGMTRLLYRMSLDFIPWARNLPFMYSLWKKV